MKEARVIVLIGPSGVGKSSIKLYLESAFGVESAPKFTTRTSRGTPEDERNFIFCERDTIPARDVLTFESYGALFGIQLSAIEHSMRRGKHHVIIVGDCATALTLSEMYPGCIICVLIYCDLKVLHSRLESSESGQRSTRWPRIMEEIENIYTLLGCVRFVIDNSGLLTATYEQVDRLMTMLPNDNWEHQSFSKK